MQNSTFYYLRLVQRLKGSSLQCSLSFKRCFGTIGFMLLLLAYNTSIQYAFGNGRSNSKLYTLNNVPEFFKSGNDGRINTRVHLDSIMPPNHLIATARFDSLRITEKQVPDWNFKIPENFRYWGSEPALGDFNGDGFDDFILNLQAGAIDYLATYQGSSSGVNEYPNQQLIISDSVTIYGIDIYDIKGVGDVNGDGYDDLIVAYENSNTGADGPFIYYGSPTGLSENSFEIEGLIGLIHSANKIGDVNGDGFDDIIFIYDYPYLTGRLYYGSASGLNTGQSWPSGIYNEEEDYWASVYSGDFNNDGYSDIAVSGIELLIFHGSSSGLPDIHQQKINLFGGRYEGIYNNYVRSGDYNGDHYSDLLLIALNRLIPGGDFYRLVFFFIPGSPNSLDTTKYLKLQDWNASIYNINHLSNLGDINNDGFSDFSFGSTIYFGGTDGISFNDDLLDLNTMNFKFNDQVYGFGLSAIGDLNNDGSTDFYRTYPELGIYYAPKYEPFNISCPDTVVYCYAGPDQQYSIPLIDISNSHFAAVQYSIYDSLWNNNSIRSGIGLNASGTFNANSMIVYAAEGYNNTTIACTTAFKFNYVPVTGVSIKPNSAHPKGDPNTFYIGYGETAFRLAALPAGGGGPYTYLWSNGSTEKNPRISESVPGEYPYWVKMKNVHGCESSDTAIIKVENALCSSPLVDVVMSQYPAILQNPLLANLIKSNSKIAVCKDGQTMCFTKAVVDIRIERAGYTIGACTPGVIPAEAFMTDEMEEILRGGLKVIVAPNPSSHAFQLNVVSIYNEPVMIRIMDLAGRQVEVLNNASSNQTITIGHKLRAGTYIAEVISGKEREVVKLVKMQ